MREFKRYNPLQIAKYVKTLFKGQIQISNIGYFEFDKGRVLAPTEKDKQRLNVMTEINRKVLQLNREVN